MDDNHRRRRLNDAPYSGSDARFATDSSQVRAFPGSSVDRYRPAPLATSSATGRGIAAYSGYYPEASASFPTAMPQSNMSYSQGYGQDQRQQQQNFAGYNPDLMYNVAQQPPPTNVYDTTSQFQARQPAPMQMLSDVAAPYFPNEAASTPSAPSLQHHGSTGSSGAYQQHQSSPDTRAPLLQQNYGTGIPMGGILQVAPEIMDEEDFQQPQAAGMEAAYTTYQTALKEIFQNIINGRLSTASESLLEVSEWLLGHVGDLGLTVDEVSLHSDRIRLWGEFNTAWLGIFQKQKDMLEAGQLIQHPQTLMTQDFIHKMGKDLVRMCDAVEKHGLVDYQYGVAEEQIIMIIEECLDLQEGLEGVNTQNTNIGRAPP